MLRLATSVLLILAAFCAQAQPRVLWSAGMEFGDLREWEYQFNSDGGQSTAVLAASEGIPAKSGSWVMKQTFPGVTGGTRTYRFSTLNQVYRAGEPLYYSFWAYFPEAVQNTGFFNLLQVQAVNADWQLEPVWILGIHPTNSTLKLEWWGRGQMEGPQAGEHGGKAYEQPVPVPVGQWVFIQFMVTPREDFSGAVKVWLNDAVVFDVQNVRTKFPESYVPDWAISFLIGKDAYGMNLASPNHRHYIDDVTISLDPLPYSP